MANPDLKNKINRMLNVFENDSGSPESDYTSIYLYKDGNNNRRQVTLGRGFTDDGGNLKKVVERYIKKGGKYADNFKKYLNSFGKGILDDDRDFLKLLVLSGKEDQIMRDAQDEIFDEKYWNPAEDFFNDNKFTLPLSLAVILDSYLHSGSILLFLRKRFPASVPLRGGNEKDWINQYVKVRRSWLKSKGKPLSNTLYRPDFFLSEIKKSNWNFNCPLIANDRKLC